MPSHDAILKRLLGSATLSDVADAFSGEHPSDPRYTWSGTAVLKGEQIVIDGRIFFFKHDVGRFRRRLVYRRASVHAHREWIEIDDEHQNLDVGGSHYARCLRFYDALGIRHVVLEAESKGVIIWPQFGFDLTRRKHRDMLLRLLKDEEIEPLPDAALTTILAPDVAAITFDDDIHFGRRMLQRLAARSDERLPMSLDLHNPVQRTLLIHRGIFAT